MDSIRRAMDGATTDTICPFDPECITDYCGYILWGCLDEISRLQQYRAEEKWVNS